ncbi:DUF1641 domain-containing protein [Pullulanibacillus sp. KACC 23026]|uniref:DUF1641 domain-containing protein n=1 Tax=Pullulanibacillus sp. KACC 23026 TaxID=3028315 RepID=UPI0023B0CC4F|nr:DUF1641 domain-containing protein [Pullulanibacillus sp. KACC 23026]WEG13724.1 DUF1641 domain-containing protein [Pullulanibacillus sp. KACC 23026]
MSENTQVQTAEAAKLDVIDQLLKPEVQESLTTLVDNLPKLTELVTLMTSSYDVVKSLATDEVLKNDTVGAITEVLHPVTDSVKKMAATAIEAKDQAEASHETIGLFGLLRIIKDPQIQKVFRFLNAYLEISNRKEK